MNTSIKTMRTFYNKLSTELLRLRAATLTDLVTRTATEAQMLMVINVILMQRGAK